MSDAQCQTKAGFVALIGRANVGKSSLFNTLVGEPLSLINHKAQTTRHCIRGILTSGDTQAIFVDTPGLDTRHAKFAYNKQINLAFINVIAEVDLIVWVLDRNRLNDADRRILQAINSQSVPCLVLLNKTDLLDDVAHLLPFVQQLHRECKHSPVGIMPVSAKTKKGLDDVQNTIFTHMPTSEWLYDKDALTDAPMRFFIAETIRGELLRQLNQELPYASTVVIERFEKVGKRTFIDAMIVVESITHKRIAVGQGGDKIKSIGSKARIHLARRLQTAVVLRLWVKVVPHWRSKANSELHNLLPN